MARSGLASRWLNNDDDRLRSRFARNSKIIELTSHRETDLRMKSDQIFRLSSSHAICELYLNRL